MCLTVIVPGSKIGSGSVIPLTENGATKPALDPSRNTMEASCWTHCRQIGPVRLTSASCSSERAISTDMIWLHVVHLHATVGWPKGSASKEAGFPHEPRPYGWKYGEKTRARL